MGTRVFALDIDAEDNFHWLLATISPYESSSSSVLVVYDGETEPQSTELVWCLKNQEDNEDEDDSESYLFDDTSSSSMDEEEEEALEKRFNTASMKLHKVCMMLSRRKINGLVSLCASKILRVK